MDDAGRSSVRQPGGGLPQKPPGDTLAEGPLPFDRLFDILTLDEFHDEKQSALVTAEIESGDDIGMSQPGYGDRLLLRVPRGWLCIWLTRIVLMATTRSRLFWRG